MYIGGKCRLTLPVFDFLVIESSVSDVFGLPYRLASLLIYIYILPKTKKFGCVGRGDLTSLFKSCEIDRSQGRIV